MIVRNIKATVLVAGTYAKKNEKKEPTGEIVGTLSVLVDAKQDDVSTGEVLDLYTGKEFVGDVSLFIGLNRYDEIYLDFDLVNYKDSTLKKLVDIHLS